MSATTCPYAVIFAVTMVLGSVTGQAQTKYPANVLDDRSAADLAYAASNWTKASTLYSELTQANPDDGALWWGLGRSQAHLGLHGEAIKSYERALALGGIDFPTAAYREAQEYAARGDTRDAFTKLHDSLNAGYRHKLEIASDPDFAAMRRDPQFVALTGLPYQTTDRVRGWLHDLDYLKSEITRVHFVYRDHRLPAGFVSQEARLRREISRLSDAAVLLKLQQLVADLGDGHSLIYPAGMNRGKYHVLPLKLYWFSDGLFIVGSTQYPNLVGGKVLAIGGVDPIAVLNRIHPYISHDNESEVRWVSPGYLIIDELLQLVGVPDHGGMEIQVRLPDASVQTTQVKALERSANPDDYDVKLPPPPGIIPPLYLSNVDRKYWFQDLSNGIVYIQFNSVQNDEHETLADFSRRLRTNLTRPGVKALVLDMRRNNGGEATLGPSLLRTLIAFQVERGERSLAVLVGRDTFSAAQNFVNDLDMITNAIFVGEPTGSKPHHFGDEAEFVLPYSGAMGQLAPGEHVDSLYRDDRVWIAPAIPANLASEDYFAGRDPALDAAIHAVSVE